MCALSASNLDTDVVVCNEANRNGVATPVACDNIAIGFRFPFGPNMHTPLVCIPATVDVRIRAYMIYVSI